MIGKTLKDTQERDLGTQSFSERDINNVAGNSLYLIYEFYCVPVTVFCVLDSISINCIPDGIVVSRVSLMIASALRIFLISDNS
jgi:hypothetical protein